jgi:hypothetical protein
VLTLFNALQRQIERATEAPRERDLSAADISRLFAKTPRELVAATFDVELRHGHRSLIVTGGGLEAVV